MSESEPPSGAVEELAEWIRRYHGTYTDEALRDQLLRSGYPPDVVDSAFRLAVAMPEAVPPDAPSVERAAEVHPGDTGLGWVAGLGALVGLPWAVSLIAPPLAGLALLIGFVGLLVAFVRARAAARPDLAKGLGYALLTVILAPVVAIVGLFGYCLVTGAPGSGA